MLDAEDNRDARARGRAIVAAILDPEMGQEVADQEVMTLAVEHGAGGIHAMAYLAGSCLNALAALSPGETLSSSPTIAKRRFPVQETRDLNDVLVGAVLGSRRADAVEAAYVAGENSGPDALRDLGLIAAAALYRLHEITGESGLSWLQQLSLIDEGG